MSLTSALHIGRTGLAASQIAIQVAGNNMANAATPGFSRQIARLAPIRGAGATPQTSIGAGVQVTAIQRQVDRAIQDRLWSANADEARSNGLLTAYSQLESILGELGDNDLSSELSGFFRTWSERANQTQSSSSVVQKGASLASFVQRVRGDLVEQSKQADRNLGATVSGANQILDQIAQVNTQIAHAEVGGDEANTLRDQRDQLITQLSQFMEVSVIDRGLQGTDVLVGSVPVVLGGQSRGLEMRRTTGADGKVQVSVSTREGGTQLTINLGSVGGAIASRDGSIEGLISDLDSLSAQLAWEVNKLHSTGTNANGYASLTGTLAMATADRTRALNADTNAATSSLPYAATSGGFTVRVRQNATGATTTVRINVDLDGVRNDGSQGSDDDTTATNIQSQLDAIGGINASFDADGRLQVTSDEGFSFSFEEDSSSALALLGVNAFFTGTSAKDLSVRSDLESNTNLLAAGRYINNQLVENGTALQAAALQDTALASMGGVSLAGKWREVVQGVGGRSASAASAAAATGLVRESLEAQVAAVSGVSLDEESVNLLQYQRQYQASARLITAVDEMTQVLISMV